MFFDDMSIYEYRLPFPLKDVRCVGWLDSEHEYEIGRTPDGLIEKLESIVMRSDDTFDVHVNVVRGIHPCNLCHKEVWLGSSDESSPLGMSEVWLPNASGWLAAPSLVVHYIAEHGYLPPSAFVQAVQTLRLGEPFLGQEIYDRLVSERMNEKS